MSNEHAPTGGEGATTDGRLSDSEARTLTVTELDTFFEILADERRRHVLSYLEDANDGIAAFSELIEHALSETVEEPTADDRERVAISLHHTHLPKLADANLVEYDSRSETVRYRGDPAVSEWLALVESCASET